MNFRSVFSITVLFTVAVAEPLGCCMPRRYSGFIVNNGGYIADHDNSSLGVYVDDNVEYHYDYDKRVAAAISHRMNTITNKRGNTTVIYDYKNSKMHIIAENGTCHTGQLDGYSMDSPCIVKTLQYGATFTMHSGTHRFDVNTFDGMHSDGKLRLSMIVTADECYPVAQKIFGDDGKVQTVYGMLFADINPNGVNDALFVAPPSCKTDGGSPMVGKRDLEALNLPMRPFTSTHND